MADIKKVKGSDIKPMLMDIISDDIEVDVVLKNDTVIVSIKI